VVTGIAAFRSFRALITFKPPIDAVGNPELGLLVSLAFASSE